MAATLDWGLSMTLKRETRQQWGAKAPRNRRFDVSLKGVAIHYPGATGSMRQLTHDQHRSLLRQWQAMHMNRGSNDLEYGSLICPCLIWMEGRTEFRKSGSTNYWQTRVGSNGTAAANTSHTSVQLLIGAADTPTDAEVRALAEAVATLRKEGGWGNSVLGHRDHSSTACPGDAIYRTLPTIRKLADNWTGDDDMPLNDADKKWLREEIRKGVRDALAGKDLAGEERSGQWMLQSAQRQSAKAVDLLEGKGKTSE
jgi:hypothetical protein